MFSMTGYGKGVYRDGGLELTVEVKSVNNRFLDLSVKCPRTFLAQEELIRTIVRESISRGHIDVFVSYSDKREKPKTLFVDLPVARSYVQVAKTLKENLQLQDDVTLQFLLRQPDVVRPEETGECDELMIQALTSALKGALSGLTAMRRTEGERLKKDLLARMETISDLRERIAERAPLVPAEYRKKLEERMKEVLGGEIDESRILTEAALYADKCNIDEELTRLSSHIEEFKNLCKSERVGRQLDFLMQEFNRECNTICSKSNDAALTKSALAMKNEIEKVREQVQNLE